MWAGSTIPSLRPSRPPNFFSTTTSAKPRQAYLPAAAVSAKFRGGPWRHRKDDKFSSDAFSSDEDEGNINGGRGQAVVAPLPNKTPIISSGSNHHRKLLEEEEEEEEEEEPTPDRQLSGSDVLWALQRATAHKHKKKKKKKTMTSSSSALSRSKSSGSRSNSNTQQQHEDRKIIDARAIHIKSEWTTRLDELDKRLHHLLDT